MTLRQPMNSREIPRLILILRLIRNLTDLQIKNLIITHEETMNWVILKNMIETLMIISGIIAIIISIVACVLCMKKRSQRKMVQYEMRKKQIEMATQMGVDLQMNNRRDRPMTIHV